jgi:hypothetical protein
VLQVRLHQPHVAFLQVDAVELAAVPDVEVGRALDLVEDFFRRVVVEVGAVLPPPTMLMM